MTTGEGNEGAARFSYSQETVFERPARRIGGELYPNSGYDAIWRLPNAGFVIRLDDTYIFLDPIFTSPLPAYEAVREESMEAGRLSTYRLELKHYSRWENLFREVHQMPLLPDDVQKADHLLLTHEHYDHFDPVGLKNLATQPQMTVAPKACHNELVEVAAITPESITEASYGLTLDYESFTLQVIPATHRNTPGACGYLIETRHGNIYHPGDGQFDQDEKELVTSLDVQFLLVPINDTNLGVGFAALLTQLLQPTVVIPCHYGYAYPPVRSLGGSPAEFVTALAARNYEIPNTDVVILNPGGKYVLA